MVRTEWQEEGARTYFLEIVLCLLFDLGALVSPSARHDPLSVYLPTTQGEKRREREREKEQAPSTSLHHYLSLTLAHSLTSFLSPMLAFSPPLYFPSLLSVPFLWFLISMVLLVLSLCTIHHFSPYSQFFFFYIFTSSPTKTPAPFSPNPKDNQHQEQLHYKPWGFEPGY